MNLPVRSKQGGVALITAMLITALAGLIAASLAWDNALDVRRTMVLLARDQAVQVALGAESWVSNILRQDLEDSETDHLGEIWAAELPGLPIDGGEVFGEITDLQGRFNVNNLIGTNGRVDEQTLEQFRRLLQALSLDPRFAGIAADWLDADLEASFPDGAEDPIYSSLSPPYRTANQLLTSASELAALEGMDKATLDVLLPHITALPPGTLLNVNTATAPVLQSLDGNVSVADVERLVAEREAAGFTNVEETFRSLVAPEILPLIDGTSRYFQLKVVVRIDTVRITLFSILQRSPRGDVAAIARSLGTT
ncbi:MAG: type II secretion system minor pseudopilin GspK [Woeseia sp.]|nr:type II secretion system minor pseudopilin GspK [Woeseia sp.]NNE59355.1 type II secretion system minor pseudopilin GspK [Woeseia sp.]